MTGSFYIAHGVEYLSFPPKRMFRELDLLQPKVQGREGSYSVGSLGKIESALSDGPN
jgi:hypothetical protein